MTRPFAFRIYAAVVRDLTHPANCSHYRSAAFLSLNLFVVEGSTRSLPWGCSRP